MKRVINGKTYSKIIGVKKGEFPIFGDDGELQSSGKKPSDIPEGLPSGGTQGQVLTKGASAPEWADVPKELPTIGSGDAGKVLTVNAGETGTEWSTPQSGGGTIYMHSLLFVHTEQKIIATATVLTDSSTAFTISSLNTWLNSNGYNTAETPFSAVGHFLDANSDNCDIFGMYSHSSDFSFRGVKGTSSFTYVRFSAGDNKTVITDTVTEV